jgi:hypothetical protein
MMRTASEFSRGQRTVEQQEFSASIRPRPCNGPPLGVRKDGMPMLSTMQAGHLYQLMYCIAITVGGVGATIARLAPNDERKDEAIRRHDALRPRGNGSRQTRSDLSLIR